MSDELHFRVRFHGPFHVLTGSAAETVDATVDEDNPLPESAVKGLMRASACRLGLPPELIADVYGRAAGKAGAGRAESAWGWRCGTLEHDRLTSRVSVPIDEASGTARSGAIRFAQELWASEMSVYVERLHYLPDETAAKHREVLRCSAYGINALGHDRNRGYGWVSVDEDGADRVDEAQRLAEWILDLQGEH